jgi:hypothetical protein
MRLLRLAPVLAVAAILLVASASSAGAATSSCSGSVAQGFWTHITATNTSCAAARHLIRRWIRATGFGDVDPPARATVGGYTCRIKFSGPTSESGKLTCTASGGRKVTSIGSP